VDQSLVFHLQHLQSLAQLHRQLLLLQVQLLDPGLQQGHLARPVLTRLVGLGLGTRVRHCLLSLLLAAPQLDQAGTRFRRTDLVAHVYPLVEDTVGVGGVGTSGETDNVGWLPRWNSERHVLFADCAAVAFVGKDLPLALTNSHFLFSLNIEIMLFYVSNP
jgi:hypothetical protein